MKKTEGYLSIGKDIISRESFNPIMNSETAKPYGGFWATKHDKKSVCYNEWMDYLTINPRILYYKNYTRGEIIEDDNYPIYPLKAVFFTLKERPLILHISSLDQYERLLKLYPDKNGNIDFEALAEIYNGVYVDTRALANDGLNPEIIKKYSVNSLLLFNLDCIDKYQQADIIIQSEYRNGDPLIEYNIVIKRKQYTLDEVPVLKRKRR